MNIQKYLAEWKKKIDEKLLEYLPSEDTYPPTLSKAMRYTVLAGGKRIRPILLITIYQLCGGKDLNKIFPDSLFIHVLRDGRANVSSYINVPFFKNMNFWWCKGKKLQDWVNENSIVVVQIEHIEAIDNLEEILKVKGVDASIIGPYDLSASLGYPGDFERKEVKNAITAYIKVCNKLGKPAGFHVISPDAEKVKEKIKEGFRFIGFSLDTLFLGEKIRKELKTLK